MSAGTETVARSGTEEHAIDGRHYRDVMGSFPSGVTVVTTQGHSGPVGFTCQSFFSVSIDPPLVTFSIARTSRSLAALRANSNVAINFLSASQGHLSAGFARSGTDKWQGVSWVPVLDHGAPVLDDVTGWVVGEVEREIEAGDHLLFLVRVTALHTEPEAEPLVFHRGAYRALKRKDSRPVRTATRLADAELRNVSSVWRGSLLIP